MTVQRPPLRILMAVDSSPSCLAAVPVAVDVAARLGACLRFVHVLGDGEIDRLLHEAGRDGEIGARRARAAAALLRQVAYQARRAGVDVETADLEGEPAPLLLFEARRWSADLIVLGRSEGSGTGRPYIGALTQHVLEFSEQPVLVVPRPSVDHPRVVHAP